MVTHRRLAQESDMTITAPAQLPDTFAGAAMPVAGGGTRDFAGWRAGTRVTNVHALHAHQVVLKVSQQFDANNLVRITRVEDDHAYGLFVNPQDPRQPRRAEDRVFVLWDFSASGINAQEAFYCAIPPANQPLEVDAARQRAFDAGYQVHRGGDNEQDLAGRYWWTLCRPGWSGVETDPHTHTTEADAWSSAIAAHALDADVANELA
jgi:hypothetical protein